MAHEKVLYEVQRTRYLQVYANGQGTKTRRYLNYESILYQVLIDDGQGLVYNHGQDLGTSQGRVQTEYLRLFYLSISVSQVLLTYTEYNQPHESLTNKNIIYISI